MKKQKLYNNKNKGDLLASITLIMFKGVKCHPVYGSVINNFIDDVELFIKKSGINSILNLAAPEVEQMTLLDLLFSLYRPIGRIRQICLL